MHILSRYNSYIEHFFCECPIVVNFWISIEQKVYRETGLRVELSVQTILFGLQTAHWLDSR